MKIGKEGIVFAGGDFNFPEGEKYNKGYRETIELLFAAHAVPPTVTDGTPTFKAGESYTCTGQVFMRNIGLEFCNRKTLCTTANFNLQESQHALINVR